MKALKELLRAFLKLAALAKIRKLLKYCLGNMRILLTLLLLFCGYPLHADTLILSVRQAWHSPNQIASAVVVKDVQDRGSYLTGRDRNGTLIQFPKNLIVSEKELPALTIPKNILEPSDIATLKETGENLEQLSKSNPIVAKSLKPYLAAFATYIQPEIDKFEQGNVKTDGKWIPGAEYRAKIAAEEQAEREHYFATRQQEEQRRRAIEEENRRAIEQVEIQEHVVALESEKQKIAAIQQKEDDLAREKTYYKLQILSYVSMFVVGAVIFASIAFPTKKPGFALVIASCGAVIVLLIFNSYSEQFVPQSVLESRRISRSIKITERRDFAVEQMDKSLKAGELSEAGIWAEKGLKQQKQLDEN